MRRPEPCRIECANSSRPVAAPATPTTTACASSTPERRANTVTTAVVATSDGIVFSTTQIANSASSGITTARTLAGEGMPRGVRYYPR